MRQYALSRWLPIPLAFLTSLVEQSSQASFQQLSVCWLLAQT